LSEVKFLRVVYDRTN